VKVCLAGPGAFGTKHLQALARIEDVAVTVLVGDDPASTAATARAFGVPRTAATLAQAFAGGDVDAVVLATPTPLHARQAEQCMRAGKHVLVEIPMADSLADAQRLVAVQRETGVVAMAGHVRRFNPSHAWLHGRIAAGELSLQQLSVQTHFMRRTNINALGQPRSWTDHLLWHHACHTVDLFAYQTGQPPDELAALQGPSHPTLGIAMDMCIGLKTASGALCSLSLSFNNAGPLGTVFRYICDNGTYVASYDDLADGESHAVDLSATGPVRDGVERMDREFAAAIRGRREPNASLAQCLPVMVTLDALAQRLAS